MRPLRWLVVAVFLISVGCSSLFEPSAEEGQEESSRQPTSDAPWEAMNPADDVEGMLREGPGKYAEDRYDETKVKTELDRLPKGSSEEDAYKRLLWLLAENYEPYVEQLRQLDPSVDLNRNRPDTPGNDETLPAKRLNVVILLDASGSMAGQVGGRTKMEAAKQAVRDFSAQLPEDVRVSLRVYGHLGSNRAEDKERSCQGTEVVYPLQPYDASAFDQSLEKFQPTGWTPLAASMKAAYRDLQTETDASVQNMVYVVSDGIETCGGDPVQAAQSLHQSRIRAVINIIGFDVDDAGQQALKEVAEAGEGIYVTADSHDALRKYFDEQNAILRKAWEKWAQENYRAHGEQTRGNYREHQQASEALYALHKRESERLYQAESYLQEKGKSVEGLWQTIYERDRAIWEYIYQLEQGVWKDVYGEDAASWREIYDTEMKARE